MSTRLSMLCQGPTIAVRLPAFPRDEPLDMDDLESLRSVVPGPGHVDRCFRSPALCARQMAEAMGLPSTVAPELRECDYGRWAGHGFEEIRRQEPEALADWLGDPASTPHGGESILAMTERVAFWLDGLHAFSGEILVVTHASVIRAAIIHAIGAPPSSFWRVDVAPLSMARLSGLPGRWTLASLGPTTMPRVPRAL